MGFSKITLKFYIGFVLITSIVTPALADSVFDYIDVEGCISASSNPNYSDMLVHFYPKEHLSSIYSLSDKRLELFLSTIFPSIHGKWGSSTDIFTDVFYGDLNHLYQLNSTSMYYTHGNATGTFRDPRIPRQIYVASWLEHFKRCSIDSFEPSYHREMRKMTPSEISQLKGAIENGETCFRGVRTYKRYIWRKYEGKWIDEPISITLKTLPANPNQLPHLGYFKVPEGTVFDLVFKGKTYSNLSIGMQEGLNYEESKDGQSQPGERISTWVKINGVDTRIALELSHDSPRARFYPDYGKKPNLFDPLVSLTMGPPPAVMHPSDYHSPLDDLLIYNIQDGIVSNKKINMEYDHNNFPKWPKYQDDILELLKNSVDSKL